MTNSVNKVNQEKQLVETEKQQVEVELSKALAEIQQLKKQLAAQGKIQSKRNMHAKCPLMH